MFRTIIFDLDDTLLETSRLLVPQAERESCLEMIAAGLDCDLDTCLKARRNFIKQKVSIIKKRISKSILFFAIGKRTK